MCGNETQLFFFFFDDKASSIGQPKAAGNRLNFSFDHYWMLVSRDDGRGVEIDDIPLAQ